MSAKRYLKYLVLLVILGVIIVSGVGIRHLIRYTVTILTDFILNTMEIDESYLNKLIGFFFFLCSSILVFIVLILDGEERRIQTVVKRYISKLVVEDYYTQSGITLAGAKGPSDWQPSKGSARAAASVRPKASAIEDAYKQGTVDGTFKEFFPNGNLKREARYLGGKMNGLFRTYYENGQIEQEAVYEAGEIDGLYRSYYEDGKPHQEKEYDHGQLNGVYKAFDEFGVPFFEITYRNNIQDGTDKIYDQKGVLQYLDTYKSGILINRKTYDEYGMLKFDQYFEENLADAERKEGEESLRDRESQEKEKRRQKRG